MMTRLRTQAKTLTPSTPQFIPMWSGILQRFATNQAEATAIPSVVHELLRSPSQPLDAMTRAFMKPRVGHDLSRVRVHTDTLATQSAQEGYGGLGQ